MLAFTTLLLVLSATSPNALGSELCRGGQWFDDAGARCRPCRVCRGDSREMAPCQDFADAVCMDLGEIRRFLAENMDGAARPHPWHETEGLGGDDRVLLAGGDKVTARSSYFESPESRWSQVILVILSLAFVFMVSAIVLMILRYFGKIGNRNSETRKSSHRARLFSRDRLNTTEYMNNLATLDRRLAIDEILEKRKRAIFEPQLLLAPENPYADDVFVDISGLPRTVASGRHYEDLDHRKCLLQMQDQQ